jgi:ankyrin repeat protein
MIASRVSVADCEAALNNADIDDDSLARLFRACDDVAKLVVLVLSEHRDNERAARLLIAERLDVRFDYWKKVALRLAFQWASWRIIEMFIDAGLDPDVVHNGAPSWHYAAHNKDESVILKLIANGIDVNAVDDEGDSLAHRAASRNNGAVLTLLIAAGANVNLKNHTGRTVLYQAIDSDCDAATIAQLIALSDINATDENGETPLIFAAFSCNRNRNGLDVFSMLLDAGADLWAKNSDGETVFTAALRICDDKLLAHIISLDATADVTVSDPDDGFTAMHVAVHANNLELTAKLIAAGANVNARTETQRTPLHMFSMGFGDDEAAAVAQLLIDANANVNAVDQDGDTPCHRAAFCGYGKALEIMIATGANVHARNSMGRTPLFHAQNASVMSMLIAANADVNAVDADGNSPCHAVCERCSDESNVVSQLALLRAAGAKMDVKNNDGKTALHFAADLCGIDVLAVLIDAKLDVSARDVKGNTVWHCAVEGDRVENLKFLLDYSDGWNRINVRNADGQTMLYCATSMNRAQTAMVEFLLGAGADPQARTIEGFGPLEIALAGGHERIAELLVQAGARVRAVDSKGLTACHWATRCIEAAATSVRFLVRAGASVTAISDDGRTPAHLAHATALPILRAHGANLDAADNDGNTPCHLFSSSASLAVLFALGANLRAVNHKGETPCDRLASERFYAFERSKWCDSREALLTFASCGAAVETHATSRSDLVAAILSAGGASGPHGTHSNVNHLTACRKIRERQKELFRLRAWQVCTGLQSLRVSALEMCEILEYMFAPLESLVPFDFAWRVVVKVKHFNR